MYTGKLGSISYKTNSGVESSIVILCVHGFGESSQSFEEIFTSKLAERYQIFVPDLPGFGLSNSIPESTTTFRDAGIAGSPFELKQCARFLEYFLNTTAPRKKCIIIAHSMGAIAASLLSLSVPDRIEAFINIEGFLIADKKRYSSKYSENGGDPAAFKAGILSALESASGVPIERYRRAVSDATPEALMGWARSCYEMAEDGDKVGVLFASVPTRKIYVYGERSLDAESKAFLSAISVEAIEFKGVGHWVMEEAPEFYPLVIRILEPAMKSEHDFSTK